jgi:plasmid stabilization system protein ParE
MAQVRWSLTAGNDLQDIEDFIARDSVLHAITFVDRIVESAETLLKTPRLVESFQSSLAPTFAK